MILQPYLAQDILDGSLILIDKPIGYTSFQAVNQLKHCILKHLKIKKIKIGHAGTLDPLASGLLVIATGKMTKMLSQFQAETKTYTGVITLGAYTPSYDLETEIEKAMPTDGINEEQIKQNAQSFIGKQQQLPPIFSAKKIDGKRAYESARAGKEIEMKTNEIEIFDFKTSIENFPDISFEVVCSKGTYIRSLAHDFGKRLNNIAYLKALRRTQSGGFSAADAETPDSWTAKFIEKNPR
jgi:tRNA pseudouridine55 synthase